MITSIRWGLLAKLATLAAIIASLIVTPTETASVSVYSSEVERIEEEQIDHEPLPLASVPSQFSVDVMVYDVVARYDWDVETALAIMMAESGGVYKENLRPTERHRRKDGSICYGSYGWFQIGCLHVEDVATLRDVETNVAIAYRLYRESGWSPWSVYKNGSYLRYMP